MSTWLDRRAKARTALAGKAAFDSPIPTQVVSNGEYDPPPKTPRQRQVEEVLAARADEQARKLGLDRRGFLRSSMGMAAAFLAMNQVYGPIFGVGDAEAADPAACTERTRGLERQFIFDVQTHFLHDDYDFPFMKATRQAAHQWCSNVPVTDDFSLYQFENYLQEVFLDSETDIALLSGAPSETPGREALSNTAMAKARDLINRHAGSKRLYSHAMVTPRRGDRQWLDDVDEAIAVHRPDSWKGYTVGDPLNLAPNHPWRLDDEELVYPFYEKALKAGITTICVHKGLVPHEVALRQPEAWEAASVVDVGKAARDWPDLTFVIYHAGLHAGVMETAEAAARFEKTGYIPWVSDLAEIPARFGVSNVLAEIGTSFGSAIIAYPRLAAAMLGTLIKGMGAERVLWGTDSVFYGSPQWQIEALRRLEIPEDLQTKYGYAPLGTAPDSAVKNTIFGLNAARLYGLADAAALRPFDDDAAAAIRREYQAGEGMRSNKFYGFVHGPEGRSGLE